MKAITVQPQVPNSAQLEEIPDPQSSAGLLLVQALALGVCGTDIDIIKGLYGWTPAGALRLILGHESLGRVVEAPAGHRFARGDLVVGVVRRPDPVPCPNCRVGEWDMCRNGRYTERGIKERHGYGAQFFQLEPDFAIKLPPELEDFGVLTEPASVVAKAWDQVERIGRRTHWEPKRALITGAGPIGLLAALLGVQRGLDVHVLDRVENGPKPDLVKDLGATYHIGSVKGAVEGADIVIECTGASQLILDAMECSAPDGIVCLAGVTSGGREQRVDFGLLNRNMVLQNQVVFGTVNANRRHYEAAVSALEKADRQWLYRLITRRIPLSQWRGALTREPNDVKPVIVF